MSIQLQRRKFTVDEYARMGEVGIFAPDERVELIEGGILPGLRLPADPDRISGNFRIGSDQKQLGFQCLSHQQPIERVFVMIRQFGDTKQMPAFDTQGVEEPFLLLALHPESGGSWKLQFARLPLETDFPKGDIADPKLSGRIVDHSSGPWT